LKRHVAENSTALFFLAGPKPLSSTARDANDCGMIYQKPKYFAMANCSEIQERQAFVLCDNATVM